MENIKESGLSRVYQHVQKHDCGGITAYRTYKDKEKTIEFSRKEKQNRNKLLLSKLFKLGYDVTSVKGYYPEAGVDISEKEGKEESFFVVDSNDRGSLRKDLMNLGEDDDFGAENHLHQDSILFIPRGGKEAFLIGTNINTDIGYHEEIPLGEFVGGKAGVFYSRVNGRPFLLENVVIEYN
nr:hypothetical protein [Candidatus Woesearchaeota archaeon]